MRGIAPIDFRKGRFKRLGEHRGFLKPNVDRPGESPGEHASNFVLELFDFLLVAVFRKKPSERLLEEDFGRFRRPHAGGFQVTLPVAKEHGLGEPPRHLVGGAPFLSVGKRRYADEKQRPRVPAGFDHAAHREDAQPVVQILRHALTRGRCTRHAGDPFGENLRGGVGPEQKDAFDPVKENPVRVRSAKEPRSFAHGFEPRLLHPVG